MAWGRVLKASSDRKEARLVLGCRAQQPGDTWILRLPKCSETAAGLAGPGLELSAQRGVVLVPLKNACSG